MSYVVSVKRNAAKPLLAATDIDRLVQDDASLSLESDSTLTWKDPASGNAMTINFESGELWTDSHRDLAVESFLEKLRHIAVLLDARVIGEEGEDLTEPEAAEPLNGRKIFSDVLGGVIFVISLPFLVVLLALRLPWILWKIARLR
jgi:hypothetical protein